MLQIQTLNWKSFITQEQRNKKTILEYQTWKQKDMRKTIKADIKVLAFQFFEDENFSITVRLLLQEFCTQNWPISLQETRDEWALPSLSSMLISVLSTNWQGLTWKLLPIASSPLWRWVGLVKNKKFVPATFPRGWGELVEGECAVRRNLQIPPEKMNLMRFSIECLKIKTKSFN